MFRGRLFDVYQWRQTLFDGSSAIFEKLRRPDTAYALPVLGKKVLIVRQQQPGSSSAVYGLVGGRVAEKEEPDAAARRELAEEAGLLSHKLDLWDSYQFLPKIDWAIYTFIARDCRPVNQSLDAGERIDLLEVSLDELIELAASEEFGDLEVALRLLRLAKRPEEFAAAKRFILNGSRTP